MSVFIIGGLVLINKSTNLTLNQNFNKRLIIFTTKKPKQDFPQTKITITTTVVKTNFQPLCWCNVIRKSRNISRFHSLQNLKNFIPGPFFRPFCPKNPKTRTFLYIIVPNFKSLCHCNFMQKNPEKFNALICYKTQNLFFGHFLFKNPSIIFFGKNQVNFKFLFCCELMQKIKNISCPDFLQRFKKLILGPFWVPFSPETSKQDLSPIKSSRAIVSL